MKVGKPQSKRVPVRLRHKIQKSSAAKQRKQRKEEKKNPQWRSRLKKDPGIPNLFPYKAKVLAEIEESKRRKEEEIQRKKDLAKAQRQGKAVVDTTAPIDDDDDEILDEAEGLDDTDDEDMDVEDDSNPMAALLASAQARANAFTTQEDDDDDEQDEGEDGAEWDGIQDKPSKKSQTQPERKVLPKKALEDPIKAVTKLMSQMQQTPHGVQILMDYYTIPPLVSSSTDFATRYLVEVARKRGRLGRGGIPNLHAAALIVLNDLNESRLQLPAVTIETTTTKAVTAGSKSEIQIVSSLAAPFKLEGLWENDEQD